MKRIKEIRVLGLLMLPMAWLVSCCASGAMAAGAAAGGNSAVALERIFEAPPQAAKPGVYWFWMGHNLSKEGITRDLEALHGAGFGKTLMCTLSDCTVPNDRVIANSPTPDLIAWTEPWWKLVRHAAEESKRLNMEFGMSICPGYETGGGPWIKPEHGMQKICYSATNVTGGTTVELMLAQPPVRPVVITPWPPVIDPATGKVARPATPEKRSCYRDIALLAMPESGIVEKTQVIDLTSRMGADGRLSWEAPAGRWTIYRFGHTTMGAVCGPCTPEVRGLEYDKMSVEAFNANMDYVLAEVKKHLGDLIGTGFHSMHIDSFESGGQNWTPKMGEEFAARRGYDLTPYLPTLLSLTMTKQEIAKKGGATGIDRVIGSAEETAKFKADFKRTIEDLYRDVHFALTYKRLKEAGLDFSCEPYGGPWRLEDVLPYVGQTMFEFWTTDTPKPWRRLNDAYLKKQPLAAEAFTGGPQFSAWTETLAWLKPIGDAAYCAGVNRFILHRFVQQPWDDRYQPGNCMGWWGTHFDRTQTWWEPFHATVKYWQRCQALLQWGEYRPDTKEFQVQSAANAELNSHLTWIHRAGKGADVFFIANTSLTAEGEAICSFAVSDRRPELWDAIWGTRRDLPEFEVRDGRMLIPLQFAPGQSWFVVFREQRRESESGNQNGKKNFPAPKSVVELADPWQVSFDPKWGGPASVEFKELVDWTQRPEAGIKYYSGTATYRKTFDVEPAAGGQRSPVYLSLGTVNHIARVRLNGKDLGVVWCAPWQVAIPAGLLKATGNQLEIEVTNTWRNRLIGDEQEPADSEFVPSYGDKDSGEVPARFYLKSFPDWFVKGQPRPSKGRYCFTTYNYFRKDSPLQPSGLVGPVRVLSEERPIGNVR